MTTTGYICCMYCNIPLVNDIENNDYLNRTDQPIGHSFQNGDWMCSKCYELYKIKKKVFLIP